jgi:tRNA threonylcarbamoyladenosine biosynthesis protein TsaB
MGLILQIESSHSVCSVSLAKDSLVLLELKGNKENDHAAVLARLCREVVEKTGYTFSQIQAIAISIGPGSYTGLRIGLSTAKGLCYGLGIPLLAVPTLQIMSQIAIDEVGDFDALYCPMIDARRNEVYTALYDGACTEVSDATAFIVDTAPYEDVLTHKRIICFGSGASKLPIAAEGGRHEILTNFMMSSFGMRFISDKLYKSNIYNDLAYTEPFYLKAVYITKSGKNKI